MCKYDVFDLKKFYYVSICNCSSEKFLCKTVLIYPIPCFYCEIVVPLVESYKPICFRSNGDEEIQSCVCFCLSKQKV